jgi:hypothetical protein
MLEIAKSNGKTSNNSIRLVAATLAINIAKLAATTLIVLVIATPFKLTTLVILIIAAPLKHNTYKAIRGCVASSTSWSNYIKGVLSKLINLIAKKF